MDLLKTINVYRRKITKGLTKNIGTSNFDYSAAFRDSNKIKKILITRPNHRLGNLLLITPLVQEVVTTFPNCEIDLYVKGGLAPIIFKNYENINVIIELPKKPFKNIVEYIKVWFKIKTKHYEIVINVDKNSSSGRLSTKIANAKYKYFGEINKEIQSHYKDHEHIAKYPIYGFRSFLSKIGFKKNENKIPSLDLKLSVEEETEGRKIIQNLVKNNKKTISVFTYATDDKCYSESWWKEFYDRLKTEYKDYNIIEVLPVENRSQIGFLAPTFYSKDIREIGSVIAGTAVFIGADSGIMHLANASQTPTIGLFSRANNKKYQPYNNRSQAINTNNTNVNDWIKIIDSVLIKN